MKHNILVLAGITLTATLLFACSGGDTGTAATDAPAARVFIVSPASGSKVTSPVTVEFGIEGYALAPAGTGESSTGHHHLLVDTPLPPLDQPIPSDEQHLHFGKAQSSALLKLEPGDHTLQLLLGDGNHVPHDTALISDPILITVVEDNAVE
jgi:hypothetical protein